MSTELIIPPVPFPSSKLETGSMWEHGVVLVPTSEEPTGQDCGLLGEAGVTRTRFPSCRVARAPAGGVFLSRQWPLRLVSPLP